MIVDTFNERAAFCEFLDAVPINNRLISGSHMKANVYLDHAIDKLDNIPETNELINAICEMMTKLSDSVSHDLNILIAQELTKNSVRDCIEEVLINLTNLKNN